jgi:hypothetical protein
MMWLRIRPGVPLIANGKVIAVAKQPFYLPWNNGELDVCAGKTNLFSVWEDFWDCPVFIYPFADGKRFLCIDDDDTSMLVFVVDLNPSATNFVQSPLWPSDDYVRNYIAGRMTNVVMNTKGIVRLPTYSELQETSSYLANPTREQTKHGSFRVYSFHWSKQFLLPELDTNRNKVWP